MSNPLNENARKLLRGQALLSQVASADFFFVGAFDTGIVANSTPGNLTVEGTLRD